MTTSEEHYLPRLNHVAFTMDPDALDDAGRAEILDFYGDVFGWTEGDNSMEQGNPLILYTGEFAQFVYLLPGSEPLRCPALDHFGFQVATREELEAIVDRAKARQASDERSSRGGDNAPRLVLETVGRASGTSNSELGKYSHVCRPLTNRRP